MSLPIQDTFTDSDQYLNGHTSDSGHGWAAAGNQYNAIILGNAVAASYTTTTRQARSYVTSEILPGATRITADLTKGSDAGGHYVFLFFWHTSPGYTADSLTKRGYIEILCNTNQVNIGGAIKEGLTTVHSQAFATNHAWPDDTTKTIDVYNHNGVISVYLDGQQLGSDWDISDHVPTEDKYFALGITEDNPASGTIAWLLDNLTVQVPGAILIASAAWSIANTDLGILAAWTHL